MKKEYQNKSLNTEEEQVFFFPKANPPQTVKAKNREEAEKLIIKNKKI